MLQHQDTHTVATQIRRSADVNGRLPLSAEQAVYRLLQAHEYAAEAGRKVWDFALTISELLRDGVTESDLRWLVCRGYVEHAKEVVSNASSEREFIHRVNLRFDKRTAFVLTDAGLVFGSRIQVRTPNREVAARNNGSSGGNAILVTNLFPQNGSHRTSVQSVRPKWDQDRRELRLGPQLVKVFKLPSPMQEVILTAFEEEHWPPRVDDPLPVHPDLIPKRRLHDTIKGLNRNQKTNLIRFMGDGSGEGIRWELNACDNVAEAASPLFAAH